MESNEQTVLIDLPGKSETDYKSLQCTTVAELFTKNLKGRRKRGKMG